MQPPGQFHRYLRRGQIPELLQEFANPIQLPPAMRALLQMGFQPRATAGTKLAIQIRTD